MGELNRRPDAPEPADRPEPSRTPNRAPKRVPAPVTGLRPRDAGAARAEIADLKAQAGTDRAAIVRPDARREPDRPENDPKLDAAYAEIAELRRQVHARDTKLDAAETKIAAAEAKIAEQDAKLDRQQARLDEQDRDLDAAKAEFDGKVSALESRFEAMFARQERHLSDLEARRADQQPEQKRPDTPDGSGDAGRVRVRDRELDDETQDADGQAPKSSRRGPSDAALGFMSSGMGVALTEASLHLPPGPAHAVTLAGGMFSMAVSGVTWLRNWRKARNADRPPG